MSAFWRATLTFRDTSRGLNSQNVLFFEDPSETKTADSLAAAINGEWWGNNLSAHRLTELSSFNVVLQTISLQKVAPSPPGGTIPLSGNLSPGVVGGATVHPSVGFCFTLLDGGSGRKHRGRVYHSSTVSSLISNGAPNSSALTAFNTLRTQWLNAFGPLPTTTWNWVLFHRNEVGSARFTRITDIRLSPFARIQRRRNYGVGF
jgi:hypothetical protein